MYETEGTSQELSFNFIPAASLTRYSGVCYNFHIPEVRG